MITQERNSSIMKFVIVGLGSMGKRRARLLKAISSDFEVIGVDARADRCKQFMDLFNMPTYNDLAEALEFCNPDCVIVSTSPKSHGIITKIALNNKCNVFSEINLIADYYEENMMLAKANQKTLFLSSTFMYRDEIGYIENKVKTLQKNVFYNYHVGQYLPDWHPWEKITDFFVQDRQTNGCRELFAIELPWIVRIFGPIKSFSVSKMKVSSLEISYNDSYQILIEHSNGNKGVLATDVVSRKPVRKLEVYNDELYLTWEGNPNTLKEYDFESKQDRLIQMDKSAENREDYASFIIENAYQNELVNFINSVKGIEKPKYSFEEDLEILKLIDQIEK